MTAKSARSTLWPSERSPARARRKPDLLVRTTHQARPSIPACLFVILPAALAALAMIATSGCSSPAGKPTGSNAGPPPQIVGGGLPPGCVCHSKNPRLVSMHNLFSIRDCGGCHKKSERLMSKKNRAWTPERVAGLRARMRREAICRECHRGKRVVPTKRRTMSGRLFCPIDEKLYTKTAAVKKAGGYYCPKHGDELVDVDAVAVASSKKPSNKYCAACHPTNDALGAKHAKVFAASKVSDPEDCLKCHTSHSKCGGCHF